MVCQNVAAILTLGGWTGSQYFSSDVATDANRTAFAKAIQNVVSTYKLDGVDFECVLFLSFIKSYLLTPVHSWEYPGKQGIGCNVNSPSDSANFLLFLQLLRQAAPNLILSAAVSLTPFNGPDGKPMTNVAEFAKVLDYIG